MSVSQPRPTSIRIFLADGVPDELRIIDKSNWTGRAVVVSRSQASRIFERQELGQPGAYVLTGLRDDGASRLYVGEADVLRDRIRDHVSRKDFWTRLVAFTSTNEGLNKAHVRYLESRFLALARAANQWELDNSTEPTSLPLSEADKADAKWFLKEMLVIFPLLGVDAFEEAATQATPLGSAQNPTLYLNERGSEAKGRETGDGFIVFKGFYARPTGINSIRKYVSDLRDQLRSRGVLADAGSASGSHRMIGLTHPPWLPAYW